MNARAIDLPQCWEMIVGGLDITPSTPDWGIKALNTCKLPKGCTDEDPITEQENQISAIKRPSAEVFQLSITPHLGYGMGNSLKFYFSNKPCIRHSLALNWGNMEYMNGNRYGRGKCTITEIQVP